MGGKPRQLRVGDKVRWSIGAAEWSGEVVEDHGNIGVGGRQLVRVGCRVDGLDTVFMMPAADLRS